MRLDERLTLLDEFERCAEVRRRKVAEAFEDDRRWFEDKRREAKQDEERRQSEETALATPAQLAGFNEQLDRYDTAVVHALMDNRQALDRAEDALAEIRRHAFILPDGRRAYLSEDGQHVFDEAGASVGSDIVDPTSVPAGAPTWQQRQAAGQGVEELNRERGSLLTYQAEIDRAREQAGRRGVTQADLHTFGDDLGSAMPDAVRERLNGPDQNNGLNRLPNGSQLGPDYTPVTTGAGATWKQPAPSQG